MSSYFLADKFVPDTIRSYMTSIKPRCDGSMAHNADDCKDVSLLIRSNLNVNIRKQLNIEYLPVHIKQSLFGQCLLYLICKSLLLN